MGGLPVAHHHAWGPFAVQSLLHQTLPLAADFSPGSQPALMPTCPWDWAGRSVRVKARGKELGLRDKYKTVKGRVWTRAPPESTKPTTCPRSQGRAPVWAGVSRGCGGVAPGLAGWVGSDSQRSGPGIPGQNWSRTARARHGADAGLPRNGHGHLSR